MSKKFCLLVGSIAVIGVAIAFYSSRTGDKHHPKTEDKIVEKPVYKNKDIGNPKKLHKDILRQIASGKDTVYGISPDMAEKELERRAGDEPEIDKSRADVRKLPFEIVKFISKSPVSLAGISPKRAMNELVRRYLSIDLPDSDDVNSAILLEALNHRNETKVVEDWAKNEDAEAVEAFLKEEADRDPSSIANFALGLKKLDSERDVGMSYMERYATHAHGDAFDNPDEEKSYKELIEAIKKLK